MFTHVRVGCSDQAKSKAFYDAVLSPLGIPPSQDMYGMTVYSDGTNRFAVAPPREGDATYANGGTIGFIAASTDAVDAFHAAGLAHGGTCEGAPGERGGGSMYGAYLRDPDGNKICAIKQG
jgi:catechol 2,3-dioxygenase-like lactoylglutathione lyase family enzyme